MTQEKAVKDEIRRIIEESDDVRWVNARMSKADALSNVEVDDLYTTYVRYKETDGLNTSLYSGLDDMIYQVLELYN